MSKYSAAEVADFNRAAKDAQTYVEQRYVGEWVKSVNGWQIVTEGGTYRTPSRLPEAELVFEVRAEGAIPLLPGRDKQGAEPAHPISSSPRLQRRI